MSTVFPGALDTLVNPTAVNPTDAPSHSSQHINSNDAIEAMQAKIGIDGSLVTSSLDYKVNNASSVDPGHEHTLATGANDVTASVSEVNQLTGVAVGGNSPGDIVTTDDTQTLTGKTIAGGSNTISGLTHGSQVDNPSSGVHGVVGSVVGTSDSQNLSGKTVTDVLTFSGTKFANLIMTGTAPGTPATGDVYLDDGTNTGSGDPSLKRWNGSAWVDIGGGTVSPLTTKGDVYTFDTDEARLPSSGVNGQVLRVNTATATGLEWGAASGYTPPVTTKGDLFGFDTAAAAVPVGTNGQVLTADSTDAQGVSWQSASSQALVKGEVPSGTKDSSNVTFTLATTPITGSLQLYINGIRLKLTDDYTITGGTITMGTAPNSGDILLADYATSTGTFSTGSTSFIINETPSGTIDSSNTAFDTASNFVAGSILVYLDGQLQKPGASYDYVETDSNTITFNTAPVSGSVLLVSYQSAVSASGNADTLDGYHANTTPTASNVPVLDSNTLLPEAIGAYRNSMSQQAIMNGNFDIWQRGTTATNPTNATFPTADRFLVNISNTGTLPTSIIHSRENITPGDIPTGSFYMHRVTTNGAGSGFGINDYYAPLRQKIEYGTRYLCGLGKQVTVSFYARSSISGKKMGINLYQDYGTGGSPSSVEVLTGNTWTLTSSWVKYSFTFNTNTLVGKTFGTNNNDNLSFQNYIEWGSGIAPTLGTTGAETFGGSGNIDISQIQVCSGSVALPFQPKSYVEELALCQRYYFASMPDNSASSAFFVKAANNDCAGFAGFPVTMRIAPTNVHVWNGATVDGVFGFSSGAIAPTVTAAATANGIYQISKVGGFTTEVYGALFHYKADAEL
jgi:hypothetical protein